MSYVSCIVYRVRVRGHPNPIYITNILFSAFVYNSLQNNILYNLSLLFYLSVALSRKAIGQHLLCSINRLFYLSVMLPHLDNLYCCNSVVPVLMTETSDFQCLPGNA